MNAFVYTLGLLFATLLTAECALIWLLDDEESVLTDRAKVRVLFGQKSWRELRAIVWSRRAADGSSSLRGGSPRPAGTLPLVRPYRP